MLLEESRSGRYARVSELSALFLKRLHEIAGEVYADGLSSGSIRPEEMEAELQRYFVRKKSGLQDVYSYYGEQWEYYHRVVAADDAGFLPLLQQARSAFARLYRPAELDAAYYMEQLVRYSREDTRWQMLRRHFTAKWKRLLEERERAYQAQHIERLCADYFRMASSHADLLQNVGGRGDGLSPRLAWLQLTQSPELRAKLRQLSYVMRGSPLVQELTRVLGRKQADDQRLYRAMGGRMQASLFRPATQSDIVGITEGNNLNALLPMEYCFLSDAALEPFFYRRYAEKKLAVFDAMSRQVERVAPSPHAGRDLRRNASRGPFVVCVDTSGSMAGEQRELLSKAIVLSLALVADKLNRPCRVVLFSDQAEVIELENLYADLALLETFLCGSFRGGSDMACALKDSVEALLREDFRYADLLWVSDFEMEPLPPMWVQYVEELKQRGMRLYAVAFGHRAEASYLRQADRVWRAD